MSVHQSVAKRADDIRTNLDKLDKKLDGLSARDAQMLNEVYKSINIILKAQDVSTSKPSLSIVRGDYEA